MKIGPTTYLGHTAWGDLPDQAFGEVEQVAGISASPIWAVAGPDAPPSHAFSRYLEIRLADEQRISLTLWAETKEALQIVEDRQGERDAATRAPAAGGP